MIKLNNILNELNINNPNITVEKVNKYFEDNFYDDLSLFKDQTLYYPYKQICKPYCEKYDIGYYLGGLVDFEKLSQSDLNKFYREMRALVRKHNGTEMLNELNINKIWNLKQNNWKNITAESYFDKMRVGDIIITPNSNKAKITSIEEDPDDEIPNDTDKYIVFNYLEPDEMGRFNSGFLTRAWFNQINKSESLLEVQNNQHLMIKPPFRNNNFEQGKNVVETIINFIRANPFQSESTIYNNIAIRDWYYPKLLQDKFRDVLKQGVLRKPAINPVTKRKIWVYYLSQDKLFELNVNNPNITAEKVKRYYINNIINNDNEFGGDSEGWQKYLEICTPYCEKYKIKGWIGLLYNFKKFSQSDLNKFYREMRILVQKHVGKEIL